MADQKRLYVTMQAEMELLEGKGIMTENELLLAISHMMDQKLKCELQPIKNDLQTVKNEVQTVKDDVRHMKLYQENIIMPRLNTIESCYTDTYSRYRNYSDKMESAFEDMELLKKVVSEHSMKRQALG